MEKDCLKWIKTDFPNTVIQPRRWQRKFTLLDSGVFCFVKVNPIMAKINLVKMQNLFKRLLEQKESMLSNKQVLMYFSEVYKNNTHIK